MSRLTECLEGFNSIAVTGMCKNAGKTTVVNHLIDCYAGEFQIGLTSIGYDGEEKDEITRLSKPRINVYPGMLVATCEDCLVNSTAGYGTVLITGIQTVLGEVLVVKITRAGIMEVSGPPTVSGIEDLCQKLMEKGCQKIIVDGSAGRLSFASVLDCSVLCVGAALSQNMTKAVHEASHLSRIQQLEACKKEIIANVGNDEPYKRIDDEDRRFFIFRGAMADKDLTHIMKHNRGVGKVAVVKDASSVFISPGILKKFLHRDGEIRVRRKTNLAAVTINPMSPYGKWFDKDRFMDEMKKNMNIPVINVMDEKE